MQMHHYAVVGYPIVHSLSPDIHRAFALQTGIALTYQKMEVQPGNFKEQVYAFFAQGGAGLNITAPFKVQAYVMANMATQRCQQAKAANTLWVHENNIYADNTDGVGLVRDLARYIDIKQRRILILGAGGAVRGILGPLFEQDPDSITVANRTVSRAMALQQDFSFLAYSSIEQLSRPFDIIIHAAATGSQDDALQLPSDIMCTQTFCYDLSYHRHKNTSFVNAVAAKGCVAVDGLGMLIEQAAEAFYIWHGVRPDVSSILENMLRTKKSLYSRGRG